MRGSCRSGTLAVAGLVAAVACGGGSPAIPPTPARVEPIAAGPAQPATRACTFADSTASAADTVRIAVVGPLHAHTFGYPESEGDQFVFRQLYETLLRVDCEGSVSGGLAGKWNHDQATGLSWAFELAPGALFADGSPIDANAVAVSLRRVFISPEFWPYARTMRWAGAGFVDVQFDATQKDAARAFSDPRLAVIGPVAGTGTRGETGPFRIAAEQVAPDGTVSTVVLDPRDPHVHAPILKFVSIPAGTDLRDALDRGVPGAGLSRVDVLVTRDPDVLAYADRRAELRAIPLPWDRTYVLVAQSEQAPTPDPRVPSPESRSALARDAITTSARGAEPPFWWQEDSACVAPAAPHLESMRREVGYPAGDLTARQLAERMVAVATSSSRPDWIPPTLPSESRAQLRIAALAPDSIDDALVSGRVAAAVVAYPRAQPAGCGVGPRLVANRAIIPLVDSRAHVIVRRTGVAFSIEGDGGIRFIPGGRP
jgi:hypothetical protein